MLQPSVDSPELRLRFREDLASPSEASYFKSVASVRYPHERANLDIRARPAKNSRQSYPSRSLANRGSGLMAAVMMTMAMKASRTVKARISQACPIHNVTYNIVYNIYIYIYIYISYIYTLSQFKTRISIETSIGLESIPRVYN